MSNSSVNTNVLALNAHRNLGKVATTQSKTSARLSSGLRINTAADDAAGLAISEKMRGQIRGLDQASTNAQDGISLIQTAEGGMSEITEMVQRVRELTVQASNETNTSEDVQKISTEVYQLSTEIHDMASRVEFNDKILLDGSVSKVHLQIGANESQSLSVQLEDVTSKVNGLSIDTSGDDSSGALNSAKLSTIDSQLGEIATMRSTLGAYQNRLEYTINSLDVSSENLSASESRIRDADMGKEMMAYTSANVLQQAATSMLSQANQAPQMVLQLLG